MNSIANNPLPLAAKPTTAPRLPDVSRIDELATSSHPALQVEALLYMLERFPLAPDEVPRMLQGVTRGVVRLCFLELSSPVPVLYEVPGHPALERLRQAIERNQQLPQFRAAQALQKWKSLHKLGNYHRWERVCMDRHRQSLPWPTSLDYRTDREAANRQMDRCCEDMRAYERRLRSSRQQRKQRLRELAGVAIGWHDLVQGLAQHLQTAAASLEDPT